MLLKRYTQITSPGYEEVVDTLVHLPYLREQSRGNVLEIGTDVGNSTTALLLGVEEKGGHVFSIDINPKCASLFPNNENWSFIHADSAVEFKHASRFLPCYFDVLYIDGNHSYEGCKADLDLYGSLVRPSGIVLVHDVIHPEFPGVRKAFDEFCATDRVREFGVRYGSWGLGVAVVA